MLYHVLSQWYPLIMNIHEHSSWHMNWIVLQSCKASLHWSFLVMKDLRWTCVDSHPRILNKPSSGQTNRKDMYSSRFYLLKKGPLAVFELWLMTAAISSFNHGTWPTIPQFTPQESHPWTGHPHVCRWTNPNWLWPKNLRNTTFFGVF